jgi:hypothetical protein
MKAAASNFTVIPGIDDRDRLIQFELRPAHIAAPTGASVRVWHACPDLEKNLNPPAGWHWYALDYVSNWLSLQFKPTNAELLQEALCILNDGAEINAPDVWDLSGLADALYDRTIPSMALTPRKRIERYVELSVEYLIFADSP